MEGKENWGSKGLNEHMRSKVHEVHKKWGKLHAIF